MLNFRTPLMSWLAAVVLLTALAAPIAEATPFRLNLSTSDYIDTSNCCGRGIFGGGVMAGDMNDVSRNRNVPITVIGITGFDHTSSVGTLTLEADLTAISATNDLGDTPQGVKFQFDIVATAASSVGPGLLNGNSFGRLGVDIADGSTNPNCCGDHRIDSGEDVTFQVTNLQTLMAPAGKEVVFQDFGAVSFRSNSGSTITGLGAGDTLNIAGTATPGASVNGVQLDFQVAPIGVSTPGFPTEILHFGLNERGPGGVFEEISHTTNVATTVGSLGYGQPGLFPDGGTAMDFTRGDGGYVDGGTIKADGSYVAGLDNDKFILRGAWTVSAWINIDDTGTGGGDRTFVSNDFTSGDGFLFFINQNNELGVDFGNQRRMSGISLNDDQNYFVAIVFDDTDSGSEGQFAVFDGVSFHFADVATSRNGLNLEGIRIGSFRDGEREFDGLIDDVRFFRLGAHARTVECPAVPAYRRRGQRRA